MPQNRKQRRMAGDQLATPEATPALDPAAPLNPGPAPAASSEESGPGTANGPDGWSALVDRECSKRDAKLRTAQRKLNSSSTDKAVVSALTCIRDCFTPANPRFNEVLPSSELVDFDGLLSLLRSASDRVKGHVINTLRLLADFRPTEVATTLAEALSGLDEKNVLLAIEAINACGDPAGSVAVPSVAALLRYSSPDVRRVSAQFLRQFTREAVLAAMDEVCSAIQASKDEELQLELMQTIVQGSRHRFSAVETAKALLKSIPPQVAEALLRRLGEVRLAVALLKQRPAALENTPSGFFGVREIAERNSIPDGRRNAFYKAVERWRKLHQSELGKAWVELSDSTDTRESFLFKSTALANLIEKYVS